MLSNCNLFIYWSLLILFGAVVRPLFSKQHTEQSTNNSRNVVQLLIDSPAFLHDDVKLECRYKLNNKKVYSIKWYKNDKEFFQYLPHENPPAQHFYSRGITLKAPIYEISNNTIRLWLKHVNLDSQGVYGCAISTDAPEFITFKDHKQLEVYVLPSKNPRITGTKSNFVLRSRIDLNCTSPKSKPVTTLQWLINDMLAPSDYLINYSQVNHSDGLQSKTLRLKFTVNEDHFKYGNMKLKCIAIYKKLAFSPEEMVIRQMSKKPPHITVISNQTKTSDGNKMLGNATIITLSLLISGYLTILGHCFNGYHHR